jgi:hypothetical protein
MSSTKPLLPRWMINHSVTQRTRTSPHQTLEHNFVRLLIALMTLVTLFLYNQEFAAYTAIAANSSPLYSCGASSNNIRCYATVEWDGNVTGAHTNIFTNQIYGGNCFVQNTMWLADSTDSYWIEAGIRAIVTPNSNKDSLFWGDLRPGYGWAAHYSSPLTSSDHGKFSNEDIHLLSSLNGTWSVTINGLPNTSMNGVSGSNYFNGYEIEIGMELCGTASASAPYNGFGHNQWANNGPWTYQNRRGDFETAQSPTSGYWKQLPQFSTTGGEWDTCIVGNGC